MNNIFFSELNQASEQLLAEVQRQYELEEYSKIPFELDENQISDLAQKINALSDNDIAILLLRYVYDLEYNDISSILNQNNVKGQLKYVEHLLSVGMSVPEHQSIHEGNMRSACEIALKEYTKGENADILPRYSRKFYKDMRRIKAVRGHHKIFYNILQKAAIIFIVLGLSFGIALGVNAEFRERMYRWLLENFPQFSEFRMITDAETTENSFEDLLYYKPTYIPDGYWEQSSMELYPSMYFNYINADGDMLTIIGHLSNDALVSLNTEGMEIEQVSFRGEDAYCWEKGEITYFVFGLDGYHFNIIGRIDRELIVYIAENITKE